MYVVRLALHEQKKVNKFNATTVRSELIERQRSGVLPVPLVNSYIMVELHQGALTMWFFKESNKATANCQRLLARKTTKRVI